jgi:hypothetical protein
MELVISAYHSKLDHSNLYLHQQLLSLSTASSTTMRLQGGNLTAAPGRTSLTYNLVQSLRITFKGPTGRGSLSIYCKVPFSIVCWTDTSDLALAQPHQRAILTLHHDQNQKEFGVILRGRQLLPSQVFGTARNDTELVETQCKDISIHASFLELHRPQRHMKTRNSSASPTSYCATLLNNKETQF